MEFLEEWEDDLADMWATKFNEVLEDHLGDVAKDSRLAEEIDI